LNPRLDKYQNLRVFQLLDVIIAALTHSVEEKHKRNLLPVGEITGNKIAAGHSTEFPLEDIGIKILCFDLEGLHEIRSFEILR